MNTEQNMARWSDSMVFVNANKINAILDRNICMFQRCAEKIESLQIQVEDLKEKNEKGESNTKKRRNFMAMAKTKEEIKNLNAAKEPQAVAGASAAIGNLVYEFPLFIKFHFYLIFVIIIVTELPCVSTQTFDLAEMSPPPLKKRKTTLHKTFKNELNRLEEKISQSHELMMSDFKKNVNDLKSTIKRNLSENVEDIKQNNYNFGNYERRVKACSEILQQSNSVTLYETYIKLGRI